MARTKSNEPTSDELRQILRNMFPGRSAFINTLSKDALNDAIKTRRLPVESTVPSVTPTMAYSANSVPTYSNGHGTVTNLFAPSANGNGHGSADPASRAIQALTEYIQTIPTPITEEDVERIAAEVYNRLDANGRTELSIKITDLPTVDTTSQHEMFPALLAMCAARIPVMLVGPAGSGKTSAAEAVAHALGLPFYSLSVGPQTSKADLLGFIHGNGGYVTTALREAFEKGGLFLLDEIDAAHPGVLTILNSLLANGHASFPDKPEGVKRHPDFVVIAAANTYGTGANRKYVGRNQLDAATLDRFAVLNWNYDESFELALAGIDVQRTYYKPRPSGYTVQSWVRRVHAIRHAVETRNVEAVVSPRASLYGIKLIDCLDRETLETALVWKGLTSVQRQQIEAAL